MFHVAYPSTTWSGEGWRAEHLCLNQGLGVTKILAAIKKLLAETLRCALGDSAASHGFS